MIKINNDAMVLLWGLMFKMVSLWKFHDHFIVSLLKRIVRSMHISDNFITNFFSYGDVPLQTNKFQGLFKDISRTNYSFQGLRFI